MPVPRTHTSRAYKPDRRGEDDIITRDTLQSYLLCKVKGHLKLKGETGSPSDYETMMTRLRAGVAEGAAKSSQHDGLSRTWPEDVRITTSVLKQGTPLILRATIEAEGVRMEIDGLKRVEGPSKLGTSTTSRSSSTRGRRCVRISAGSWSYADCSSATSRGSNPLMA